MYYFFKYSLRKVKFSKLEVVSLTGNKWQILIYVRALGLTGKHPVGCVSTAFDVSSSQVCRLDNHTLG
jgi:hypothetical protein